MSGIRLHVGAVGSLSAQVLAATQSTRPGASLVAGTLSGGVAVARTGFHVQGLLLGTAMSCVTAFGFVINDILDYEKDKGAGVDRPIARDVLSRQRAAMLAVLLLLLAVCISDVVGPGRWVPSATAGALLLYTPMARRFPVWKGFYVAALCLAPLFYAAVVLHTRYPPIFYGLVGLFIVGRELLMDADEIDGDRRAGLVTLAGALGRPVSRGFGAGLMTFGLLWLNFVTVSDIGRSAAALSSVLILLILIWPSVHEEKRIALSRVPMFAAALAIAFG